METKVVKILSDTTVVLAAGSSQGVRVGSLFVIYELGDEISDPQTGESLGRLEITKGRVEVVHVQERISTAKTLTRTVRRTRNVVDPIMATMFGRTETTETDVREKLEVGYGIGREYSQHLVVKPGDLARSVD